MGKAADEIDSEQLGPKRRLPKWDNSMGKIDRGCLGGHVCGWWHRNGGGHEGAARVEEQASSASVRLNPSFANDGPIFLMVADNHFSKLVAIANINIKSKLRHALLNVGKLGGLSNGLADAGDHFQ